MRARRISTERLELVTATAQHLLVELDEPSKLGSLLAAEIPERWPPPLQDADTLRFTLDRLHEGPSQIGWWMRYVVLRKGTGKPTAVGVVGLKGPPKNGSVEIGYSVMPSHQKQGIATEAARALIDWAFEQPGVERVVAHTLDDGTPSQKVLQHLGFVADGPGMEPGTLRYEKQREAWIAEGPPSRRAPPLRPKPKDEPIAGLPSMARRVFDALIEEPLVDPSQTIEDVKDYLEAIDRAASLSPEVDAALGREIARVCIGLLEAITPQTPEWTRRQIQAAARYFVTESDGDSDLAIGGLDEDAAVANAVAEHLGRTDLVSDPF